MVEEKTLPAHDFGDHALNDTLSFRQYANHVVRKYLELAFDNEAGIRLGKDPEFVHKMRVSIRRALTALRVFDSVINPYVASHKRFLKSLIKALGRVRDLDVQKTMAGKATHSKNLLQSLIKKRAAEHKRLVGIFDSVEYQDDVLDLVRLVRQGDDSKDAFDNARLPYKNIIKKRVSKFRKFAAKIRKNSDPKDFHHLRILGKKLRYTLEFFEPIYGNIVKKMVKKMAMLQDQLGEIHDLHFAGMRLLKIASQNSKSTYNMTPGETARESARYLAAEDEKRRCFIESFKKISWHEFLTTL